MKGMPIRFISSKRLAAVALVSAISLVFAMTAGSFGYWGCSQAAPEPLVIGTMANAGDTLIFTAGEQEYFPDDALEVTLKTYVNGLAATNAMLAAEADLAYATEFVVVGKALEEEKIKIIATYSKNNTVRLAGLKASGIEGVADLKGKKIGLSRGTINEFYLGRLLNLNRLSIDDVVLVDVKLTDLESALSSGNVDAVVAWSRNLYPLIQQKGSDLFVWPAHSDQPAYGTLVARNEWLADHPETVERLLNSLARAQLYIESNPDATKAALQKKLNFDDAYMAEVWAEYQFSLTLDQSLIIAMEDEARWMIANDLTSETQVPDFLDYIYEDALKTVKPESVSIIR